MVAATGEVVDGPGWREDPSGRFDERWWDGAEWGDQVRISGRMALSSLSSDEDAANTVAVHLRTSPAALSSVTKGDAADHGGDFLYIPAIFVIALAGVILAGQAGRWGGFVLVATAAGAALLGERWQTPGVASLQAAAGIIAVLLVVPAIIWFAAVPKAAEMSSTNTLREMAIDGCVGVVRTNLNADAFGVSGDRTDGMNSGEIRAFREAQSQGLGFDDKEAVRAVCERHM